jgi:hypothetical protein
VEARLLTEIKKNKNKSELRFAKLPKNKNRSELRFAGFESYMNESELRFAKLEKQLAKRSEREYFDQAIAALADNLSGVQPKRSTWTSSRPAYRVKSETHWGEMMLPAEPHGMKVEV